MALRYNFILLIAYKLVNRSAPNKNFIYGLWFSSYSTCFENSLPSLNYFYFIFKGFCMILLHKLILKLAFLGLGWAQVYISQLGLMP
jgi:hypothetical protein